MVLCGVTPRGSWQGRLRRSSTFTLSFGAETAGAMKIQNIATLVTYLPTAAAFALLFFPRSSGRAIRLFSLIACLATFVLSLHLLYHVDGNNPGMQLEESAPWIETRTFNIRHHLGVDGISLFLVLLTTFLTPLAILSSWRSIQDRLKPYMICMLTLETGMLGVFLALDLVLFYIFSEVMLVPMYFLIGVWGGENRIYAAVKFILYTMAGSLLMFLAILYLFYANGATTFDLVEISRSLATGVLRLSPGAEFWLFSAFLLAFAIKVPLFPFHTWLPDAHVEAPTAASVILAGVLLKMGTYGLLRFSFPLFPAAAHYFAPYLGALAIVGIVYGALVAMVQPDLKKLVAYSSVSHLGFVVLGIAAMNVQGVEGAVYQMLNHGVSTGGLFLIVGMLSDRRHTRLISEYGGPKQVTPRLDAACLLITLSSLGLPGLNGVVGECRTLRGASAGRPAHAAFAATGVILSATYMLWMFQRVNYGPVTRDENKALPDLQTREWVVIVPIIAVAILMGVLPSLFLRPLEPSVERVLTKIHQGAPARIQVSR